MIILSKLLDYVYLSGKKITMISAKLLDYIYLLSKKIMNHYISFMIIIATLIVSIFLGFTVVGPNIVNIINPKIDTTPQDNQTTNGTLVPQQNDTLPPVEKQVYNDMVLFDQQTEKLNGEVVQYKITFHDNDTVNYDMGISYQLTNPGTVFYLIYLTDGKNTTTLHISDEAYSNLIDITTFRKHRKIGWNANASGETSLSNSTEVKNNTEWYLTIAVANNINETLSVSFETQKKSMEITKISRTSSVYLLSTIDADYKKGKITERYWGLSLFGIGFSHCYADVEVPVSNGGIVCVDMFNHVNGMVYVGNSFSEICKQSYKPDNTSILLSTTDAQLIKYWKVHAESIGYPKKTSVLTMVVDVYPYSTHWENDWNGYYQKTNLDSLSELGLKMIQYAWSKIWKTK
jgi:hypothetical protein